MPPSLLPTAAVLQPIRNVVSASALYPLYGIVYFVSHREYYPLLRRHFIPLTILSIIILGLLFTFTYVPQAAFMFLFHGPAAFVSAAVLVLAEGQVIIALLFQAFMVDETCVDVFDATLIREGYIDLVSPARILNQDGASAVKMLGRPTMPAIYSPLNFRQIAEMILFLPLNLIPIIGLPIFLVLTGARAGPLYHYRYFKLIGVHKKEKREEIRKRQWKYTWFGTVALMLQLVPVLSMFFILTTTCGSALWAAKLEEQKKLIAEAPVPVPREGLGTDEEAPPAYTDDPI